MKLLQNVALSAAALLLLGAALEAGFRLGADGAPHREPTVVEPDPELIWRLRPRAAGDPYATNALGFRDLEPEPHPDRRILVLGDSVSWGDGVDDVNAIYPVRLEALLDERDPGVVHDVVNTGVPGYSTFQEVRLLELRGRELAPDLVVLQFCLNDVVERYRSLAPYGGSDVFLGIDTRAAVPGMAGWLMRHSRAGAWLLRFASARNRRREEYSVRGLARDDLGAGLERAWATVLEELDRAHAVAGSLSRPLLVVVTPYRFQLAAPLQTRQPQERLLHWASGRGVAMVDLLPVFAEVRRREERKLLYDPSHFDAHGHALAARTLVAPVRSLLGREAPPG